MCLKLVCAKIKTICVFNVVILIRHTENLSNNIIIHYEYKVQIDWLPNSILINRRANTQSGPTQIWNQISSLNKYLYKQDGKRLLRGVLEGFRVCLHCKIISSYKMKTSNIKSKVISEQHNLARNHKKSKHSLSFKA